MNFITFKKNVPETLLVTDTKDAFKITNDYFKFNESNYPFDSFQFLEYLKSEKVSVVFIGESFPNGDEFKRYMKIDPVLEEQKEEQKKVFEEKVKQDEEKAKAEAKKKADADKKADKERIKKEKARKDNVTVIKDSEIEESVSKHLMG